MLQNVVIGFYRFTLSSAVRSVGRDSSTPVAINRVRLASCQVPCPIT